VSSGWDVRSLRVGHPNISRNARHKSPTHRSRNDVVPRLNAVKRIDDVLRAACVRRRCKCEQIPNSQVLSYFTLRRRATPGLSSRVSHDNGV